MDELMEILMEIDPDVDYENETQLIDGRQGAGFVQHCVPDFGDIRRLRH